MNVVFTASWLKDAENWIVNNIDTILLITERAVKPLTLVMGI